MLVCVHVVTEFPSFRKKDKNSPLNKKSRLFSCGITSDNNLTVESQRWTKHFHEKYGDKQSNIPKGPGVGRIVSVFMLSLS